MLLILRQEFLMEIYGIFSDIIKLTKGYNLPSRFVIHTVGPVYFEHTPSKVEALLTSCYENSLNIAQEYF